MRADPKKLILKQTYKPVFTLQRTIGDRKLWLILSDMHVPNSEKLLRQRTCAVYDEAAPEISETDASKLFGQKPNVNRTKFGSQLYWDPPVMAGTSYTAVVHCRELCAEVTGLKLEASLMDWKDGQHAW